MLEKMVSGGPTGVDRAALDVALALGLAVGGWCPKGRRAEEGRIPDRYPLVETPEHHDQARTRRHIEDSDGTLILNVGKLDGGTALAAAHARKIDEPCLVVALEAGIEPATLRDWLATNLMAVPNVAGPRENKGLRVHQEANGSWRRCWRRRALNPHPGTIGHLGPGSPLLPDGPFNAGSGRSG